jgi:hypothetical protein
VYVFLIRRMNLHENGFHETHSTSVWAYGLLGQSEEFVIAEVGIVQYVLTLQKLLKTLTRRNRSTNFC